MEPTLGNDFRISCLSVSMPITGNEKWQIQNRLCASLVELEFRVPLFYIYPNILRAYISSVGRNYLTLSNIDFWSNR